MPRACAALLLTLLLAGCATSVFNPASNKPMTRDTPPGMGAPQDLVSENAIAISFSGGGLRAAAFAHGVLTALKDTKTPQGSLADDITFLTSVSGGSLASAYFGLHGPQGLDDFREKVLLRDFERDMHLSILHPGNLARLFGGGLNARENFGDALDKHVFNGATFADIYRHRKPDVRIHATELYAGIPFPFIPRAFSILCSDIRSYSVADAVVASMAVPLVFAPVVMRAYPDQCNEPLPPLFERVNADPDAPRILKAAAQMAYYRDPQRVKYLKLVDGGVTDNLGLATIAVTRAILDTPYAPMTERDAVKVRRMLFIVVDASRGPGGEWALSEPGPGGVDLALAASDVSTNSSARFAADSFGSMVRDWRESLVRFRCALSDEQVVRLGGPTKGWNCDDVKFHLAFLTIDRLEPEYRDKLNAIPTRLTLTPQQVDDAIEGGRRGALGLRRLQQYIRERVPTSEAAGPRP